MKERIANPVSQAEKVLFMGLMKEICNMRSLHPESVFDLDLSELRISWRGWKLRFEDDVNELIAKRGTKLFYRRRVDVRKYALYKDNKLLATGTIADLADYLGVSRKTIQSYKSPSRRESSSRHYSVYLVDR